jgi:hypothetical protein
MRGTHELGIAYVQIDAAGTATTIRWRSSADDGVSWGDAEAVASLAGTAGLGNPSVVWRSDGRRDIAWGQGGQPPSSWIRSWP